MPNLSATMKAAVWSRYALSLLGASALLLGCDRAPLPSANNAAPQGRDVAARSEGNALKGTLLYVANNAASASSEVYVYTLPGGKLVQTLWGLPGIGGLCVNIAADVFVPMGDSEAIRQYRHGGKNPLKTLPDPKGFADDCSVDPTTGSLAVTNDCTPSTCSKGNVAIYSASGGKPKYYTVPNMANEYFCAYDNVGNLFVAGMTPSAFAFAKLPKQQKHFLAVTLNQYIRFPGGVKWDGKHIGVADQYASTIYQFDIRGTEGKKAGSTQLEDMQHLVDYSISGGTLYAADANGPDVVFYHYPAGGKPLKKIYGFNDPLSTAVSR